MKPHFTFFVTLYFVCTHIQCNIDTSAINKTKTAVLKSELHIKQVIRSDSVMQNYIPVGYLMSDVIKSENTVAADNELKGKRCLKDVNKCLQEDRDYERTTTRLADYLFRTMPPFDLSAVRGVSEECRRSSQKYVEDLNLFQFWALQMYDATAKVPPGILSGNVVQLGDFDLCLKSTLEESNIRAQYCLASMQFSSPSSPYLSALHTLVQSHSPFKSKLSDPGHRVPRFSSVQWGLCVPDACTASDVDAGLRAVLMSIFNGTEIQYGILVDPQMCQTAEAKPWPTSTIVGFCFFLAVILIEVLATLYDLLKDTRRNDWILAFSLKKNIWAVSSVNKEQNDIDAVHVIRFVNALMLLISHKSMALLYLPYINRTEVGETLSQPWTVLGRAASLYTDPFIMISGTLTAYSLFGRLQKTNKISVLHEYFSRILRILPTFAALILFCTLVLPWLNAGPMWNLVVTHHSDICKKYWWRNILFIHNYFGFKDMCLTHTHHVGIDTQLFFTSPFLILLVWKWPKRGIFTLLTLGVISTAMRYYVTYTRKLSNYIHYGTSTEQLFNTADYMYILPPHRLTVYVMGIILGYMLRNYRHVTFKPAFIHTGNVMALACFCIAFFGPAFMGNINYIYNPRDAAWYAAYAPILWCLGFGWIIYITHIGYRGWAEFILSNPIPKLWTNVSYTVYLTQFPIFFYNVGTTRHVDHYGTIRKHANFLETGWIILLSTVLTVVFELPSQNIRNIIFKRRRIGATSNGIGTPKPKTS